MTDSEKLAQLAPHVQAMYDILFASSAINSLAINFGAPDMPNPNGSITVDQTSLTCMIIPTDVQGNVVSLPAGVVPVCALDAPLATVMVAPDGKSVTFSGPLTVGTSGVHVSAAGKTANGTLTVKSGGVFAILLDFLPPT